MAFVNGIGKPTESRVIRSLGRLYVYKEWSISVVYLIMTNRVDILSTLSSYGICVLESRVMPMVPP